MQVGSGGITLQVPASAASNGRVPHQHWTAWPPGSRVWKEANGLSAYPQHGGLRAGSAAGPASATPPPCITARVGLSGELPAGWALLRALRRLLPRLPLTGSSPAIHPPSPTRSRPNGWEATRLPAPRPRSSPVQRHQHRAVDRQRELHACRPARMERPYGCHIEVSGVPRQRPNPALVSHRHRASSRSCLTGLCSQHP